MKLMVKIISCASYYGTGSSAITDFFSEFDNVFSLTNYEFRFLQILMVFLIWNITLLKIIIGIILVMH